MSAAETVLAAPLSPWLKMAARALKSEPLTRYHDPVLFPGGGLKRRAPAAPFRENLMGGFGFAGQDGQGAGIGIFRVVDVARGNVCAVQRLGRAVPVVDIDERGDDDPTGIVS